MRFRLDLVGRKEPDLIEAKKEWAPGMDFQQPFRGQKQTVAECPYSGSDGPKFGTRLAQRTGFQVAIETGNERVSHARGGERNHFEKIADRTVKPSRDIIVVGHHVDT